MGVWNEVAAQAAGEVASSGASSIWDIFLSNKTNRQNIANWERQNKYNTPSEQMKRYREAGLNPALMYGQGNSGNAQKIPDYQKPDGADWKMDIGGTLGKYQQVEQSKADVDLTKANTRKATAEAIVAESLIPNRIFEGQNDAATSFHEKETAALKIKFEQGKIDAQMLDNEYKTFRNKLWEEGGMTMNDATMLRMFIKLLGDMNINSQIVTNWINKKTNIGQ